MKELLALIVLGLVAKDIYDKSSAAETKPDTDKDTNALSKNRLPQSRDYPVPGYQGALNDSSSNDELKNLLAAIAKGVGGIGGPTAVKEAPFYDQDPSDGSLKMTSVGRDVLANILTAYHLAPEVSHDDIKTIYPDRDYGSAIQNNYNGNETLNVISSQGNYAYVEKDVFDALQKDRSGKTVPVVHAFVVKPADRASFLDSGVIKYITRMVMVRTPRV